MNLARIISQNINFKLGSISLSPTYLQVGAIIFLLFLLVLTLAQVRRNFLMWSFKGAFFGIFLGFLLALIFEGFLIISGKTAVTEILGWRNAPKPILNVLNLGRDKLINVLGIQTQMPNLSAKTEISPQEVLKGFQSLNPTELQKIRKVICTP
jgi:hypothetical protein